MNENTVNDSSMNAPGGPNYLDSPACQAEMQMWQSIRDDTRRQLTKVTTLGFFYVLAALAVGGYLMQIMQQAAQYFAQISGWEWVPIDASWMTSFIWGYALFAVVAVAAYLIGQLLIWDRLPSSLYTICSWVPWVGSTMRAIALGEWCQSIYTSVLEDRPYASALGHASESIRNSSLRYWSGVIARRMEGGQSLALLITTSPIRDQPVCATSVFLAGDHSKQDSIRIWRRATVECHQLAQSRLGRTTLFVSVTCLLISVLLAGLALFLTGKYMPTMWQAFTY
ncbi:hypothetical protein [Roseiconus lacunae]|uniref:hypothetical protein n=1 Tax=Roseiconus lacunae TaxID=2605694 RepID=UPI00135B2159|nr:hypothetical protein [Roseiconus lacunae]MCD0459250.1 hypothetical protein [Roseiconus lacunae]